jgi:hypothetical protein
MIQRIIGTLALGIIAVAAVPIMAYGSMMSAFGPGHYEKSDTSITIFLTIAVFLVPITCIWIPTKGSLILGALILAPAFLIGCLLLIIPPLGLALLVPTSIWYGCAYSLWKNGTEPVGPAKPTPPGTSAAEQPRVPGSGAG